MPLSLDQLVDRIPEGWSEVRFAGARWGLTRTTHADGRSVSVYAEELGGSDVVSANVWRLSGGSQLRPCEMPSAKVLEFLRGWEPLTPTPAAQGAAAATTSEPC